MSQTHNHLFLDAIKNKPIDRTPIWIMRQAGRYLPEYINLKNKAGGFMGLVRNPELACEITLQPLERFSLDSAIVFSDILNFTHKADMYVGKFGFYHKFNMFYFSAELDTENREIYQLGFRWNL